MLRCHDFSAGIVTVVSILSSYTFCSNYVLISDFKFRSLDFVKAERRITLTPMMETVNIDKVISLSLNFVK